MPSLLQGDSVLVKKSAVFDKGCPRFSDSSIVLKRQGSLVTSVNRQGMQTTRNVSFFTPAVPAQSASARVMDEDNNNRTIKEAEDADKVRENTSDADVRGHSDSGKSLDQLPCVGIARDRPRRNVKEPRKYGFTE